MEARAAVAAGHGPVPGAGRLPPQCGQRRCGLLDAVLVRGQTLVSRISVGEGFFAGCR